MFGYRPRKAFSLVMLADVPLEARSQSRRLHFFSVDLLCTWRDQACAVRMREAFMNGFLLDIIDRLSTQKKTKQTGGSRLHPRHFMHSEIIRFADIGRPDV
ncbi:hypothetical protein Amal_03316 [Acetobacter malorum]|uniref:Uncharacterized protein n=1 Tax=Acetobacter malorum TaxID=178901 RepID=A0A177G590_9PROT|nr:hypothetical protein Amal_03316 [Acetobacter malorum]